MQPLNDLISDENSKLKSETVKLMVAALRAFHQLKMRCITAPVFYEFLQMPFGLCNAPATFQHLMQNCLGKLNLMYALIYLDDIVVFSDTEKEHVKCLAAVFERFREHGLKLKPSKCEFFKEEINYLGHRVSTDGMKPGTDNLDGIAAMAPPTTATGIRHSWGPQDSTGDLLRDMRGSCNL